MRGAPEPGAPAPATGHSPRILFPTAFLIDLLRFELHFHVTLSEFEEETAFRRTFGMGYELI